MSVDDLVRDKETKQIYCVAAVWNDDLVVLEWANTNGIQHKLAHASQLEKVERCPCGRVSLSPGKPATRR